MGSSKKDNDKEKDREERRKRKHDNLSEDEEERSSRKRKRSRERSRSRERHSRSKRSRSRDRRRSKSRDRKRSERKKSRSKSRERRRSEHKRRRSRSRERSKERDKSPRRKTTRKEKESSRKKDDRAHQKRSSSMSDEDIDKSETKRKRSSPPRKKHEREGSPDDEVVKTSSSGDVISLSIEETNKLRAKLGLKPLDVGSTSKPATAETSENNEGEEESKGLKEDVHVPAKNISDINSTEKLKQRMATMRESRRIAKTLSSVKTLGEEDSDNDDDSAASWVIKMKKLEEEKKRAEKKAQMLAEMDREFGVGDLVSETFQEEKRQSYSSRDLKGLAVEHKTEAFKEGRDIVLTLKDSAVLDDGSDVLVNVNIIDDEKAAKNVELRKGKPGYNPYEEEEVDEYGTIKKQNILKKYDEEIDGEKKMSFALGDEGGVDTAEERRRQVIRERLKEKEVSLDMGPSRVASEYYTSEEMVQFKKPKKKRKLRKKEKLKADDLLPLEAIVPSKDLTSRRDHGSRSRQFKDEVSSMDVDNTIKDDGTEGSDVLRDDDDSGVSTALDRTRRLLRRSNREVQGAAKVMNMLQSSVKVKQEEDMDQDKVEDESLVLDVTAEFCRQIGEDEDNTTEHHRRHSYDDEDGQIESMDIESTGNDDEASGGWTEVHSSSEKNSNPKEEDLYQEAEPMVASGMAAALQLASRKGMIQTEKETRGSGEVLRVYNDATRDTEYERQRKQERERELSRYDREPSFPEKKDYIPNVRIEYVDDAGHLLNTKEAFRHLSHKFHGRTSGKKKLEKKMEKRLHQQMLNKSSSVDTPLNTLAVQQKKQKAAQSPYILLSGGSQSMLAPDIAKRK